MSFNASASECLALPHSLLKCGESSARHASGTPPSTPKTDVLAHGDAAAAGRQVPSTQVPRARSRKGSQVGERRRSCKESGEERDQGTPAGDDPTEDFTARKGSPVGEGRRRHEIARIKRGKRRSGEDAPDHQRLTPDRTDQARERDVCGRGSRLPTFDTGSS